MGSLYLHCASVVSPADVAPPAAARHPVVAWHARRYVGTFFCRYRAPKSVQVPGTSFANELPSGQMIRYVSKVLLSGTMVRDFVT